MKFLCAALVLIGASAFAAESTTKFNFKDEDLNEVVQTYAKASGQKIVYDENLKGKTTILNPDKIAIEEAFAQLSTALAVNGYGISKQGDLMVIMRARNVQRNLIPVGPDLPPLKPEQMFTWVVNLKNIKAEAVNREIRVLSSKDGELVPVAASNQLVITDWVSNLYRVQKVIAAIDIPAAKK